MNTINTPNVLVTSTEANFYTYLGSLRSQPYKYAAIITTDKILLSVGKVKQLGSFIGKRCSQYLLNLPGYITNTVSKITTNSDQYFTTPLIEKNTLLAHNITIANPKNYKKISDFIGFGAGYYLAYKMLINCYYYPIPVAIVIIGMYISFLLDFSINGSEENSLLHKLSTYFTSLIKDINFNTLPEAITYLCSLTKIDENSAKVRNLHTKLEYLNEIEKKQLLTFLQKFINTDNFKYLIKNHDATVARIIDIFSILLSNSELKEQTMCRIFDSLSGCHDHVLLAFSDLETAMYVQLIEKDIMQITEEQLIDNAKKIFVLEKIRSYSLDLYKQKMYIPKGSYIEIENIFHIVLSKKYALPVSIQQMAKQLKHLTVLITQQDIQNIENYLNTAIIEEFPEYYKQWLPKKKFNRQFDIIPYSALNVISLNKDNTTCLFTAEQTNDLVYLNNNSYSYENLKKWYLEYGTDPVSLQPMKWHDVYRVSC